ALRLRPLDGVRVRNRQGKLARRQHLRALGGAPADNRLLSGESFQISDSRLFSPVLLETDQNLVVFVVDGNFAALPSRLEQILVAFRRIFLLDLLGIEAQTRGQRVGSGPVTVAVF